MSRIVDFYFKHKSNKYTTLYVEFSNGHIATEDCRVLERRRNYCILEDNGPLFTRLKEASYPRKDR